LKQFLFFYGAFFNIFIKNNILKISMGRFLVLFVAPIQHLKIKQTHQNNKIYALFNPNPNIKRRFFSAPLKQSRSQWYQIRRESARPAPKTARRANKRKPPPFWTKQGERPA
ncbi:MAG: hypothetical protein HQL53_14830, partial [Magnetococcales bacterium]|nr:hypothetical protein [Magnetococcales bacterium]